MMVKRVPDDIEDIMKDARNGDAIALTTISSQFNGLIWREYARQDSRINPSDWYSEAQYVLYRALASLRLFYLANISDLLRKGTATSCSANLAT